MAKGTGGDRHQQGSIVGIVIIRYFLGLYFLFSAITKLIDPARFTASLQGATADGGAFVTGNFFPFFVHFLQGVVAPHAGLFAWLVIIGELLVGMLMLLGLLTRLAALIVIVLNGTFLLATLHLPPLSAAGVNAGNLAVNAAFITMAVAVLIAAAGRTWGLDRLIARRTRVKLLW